MVGHLSLSNLTSPISNTMLSPIQPINQLQHQPILVSPTKGLYYKQMQDRQTCNRNRLHILQTMAGAPYALGPLSIVGVAHSADSLSIAVCAVSLYGCDTSISAADTTDTT